MAWPSCPADFLSLDLEQQAGLLLAGLLDCDDGGRGRNFILFRLDEWFSDLTLGIGLPATLSALQGQRQQARDALEEAYALLESRALIRSDPRLGKTFCQVTAAGEAQVAAAHSMELPCTRLFVAGTLTLTSFRASLRPHCETAQRSSRRRFAFLVTSMPGSWASSWPRRPFHRRASSPTPRSLRASRSQCSTSI